MERRLFRFLRWNKSGRDEIWEYIDMMYEGFQAERVSNRGIDV